MANNPDEYDPWYDPAYDTPTGTDDPYSPDYTGKREKTDPRLDSIIGMYREFLGREPDQAGLDQYFRDPMQLSQVEWEIRNSPEGKAYAAKKSIPPEIQAPQNQEQPSGPRPSEGGSEGGDAIDQWRNLRTELGPLAPVAQGQTQTAGGTDVNAELIRLIERMSAPAPAQAPVIPPEWLAGWESDRKRQQAFEEQIRSQVLEMMRQGQVPVDADQIAGTGEARAFRRVSERAQDRLRAEQAEMRGLMGTGQVGGGERSGAFGSDIETGQMELQERLAANESSLVARELQNRRTQLQQALSLGAGLLSADQSNQIRTQLAAIDTSLRQQLGQADIGLRQNLGLADTLLRRQLGMADIDVRQQLGGGQLSLALLEAMLRNQQFNDQLGANLGYQEALLNQGSMQGWY